MLKYNVRLFLQEEKTGTDGKCPIRLYVKPRGQKRVTQTLGIKVKPKDWDNEGQRVRKSDIHHNTHNQTIRVVLSNIERKIQDAFNSGNRLDHSLVKSILLGKSVDGNLFEFTEGLLKHLDKKFAPGTIRIYNDTINHLKKFSPVIYFSDVDINWLRRFETHLRGKGISNNTLHKYWKILKRIFNSAVSEGITTNYPFRKYPEPPKYREPDRTFLTLDEVNKFEGKLKLPMPDLQRNSGYFFLLGCYSGLRFSDWQRFNPEFVQGNRLILRTKKNGELVSIEMHKNLKRIVSIVKKLPTPLEMHAVNHHIKSIALLAGIKKQISTHAARHSFAVRCAELGISRETTSELLGITFKSCGYYYKVTNRKIDEEFRVWNKLAK